MDAKTMTMATHHHYRQVAPHLHDHHHVSTSHSDPRQPPPPSTHSACAANVDSAPHLCPTTPSSNPRVYPHVRRRGGPCCAYASGPGAPVDARQ
jgi:hypothetical protein